MKSIGMVLITLVCLILSLTVASALEIDNVKRLNGHGRANRPNIDIVNAFGLGSTLWSGELVSNTDVCGGDCLAEKEIRLHRSGSLIDEIIFETILPDGTRVEQPIREYQFYVRRGNSNWEEYELGEELNAGMWEVRLEGKKKPSRTVDWIIKSQGIWMGEWAIWSSNFNTDLVGYWNFEDNTELVAGVMNLTPDDGQISFQDSSLHGKAGLFSSSANMFISNTMTGTNFDFPTNTTLSFWSNRTGGVTYMLKRFGGTGWFMLESPNLQMRGLSVSNLDTTSTGNIWANYVILRNDTHVSIWRDGILNDFETSAVTSSGAINFTLGNGANVGEVDYEGEYDEFALWNRSLSQAEIVDLYDGGNGTFLPLTVQAALVSPSDLFASPNQTIAFTCSGSAGPAEEITNISLLTNQSGTSEIVNFTTGLSGSSNVTTWSHTISEGDGNYLWTCQACDTSGGCNLVTESRTVIIDTTPPSIVINEPVAVLNYGSVGQTETLNWSVSDVSLDSMWYDYNGTNVTVFGAENTTLFILESNNLNLTFYSNDSVGNENSEFVSWEYDIFEHSGSYNVTTYETSIENFNVNVSYDNTKSITGTFYYDGTSYSTTSSGPAGNKVFTKSIAISSIGASVNKTFNWEFKLDGAGSFNSTLKNQSVNNISLTLCGGEGGSVPYINFTFKDEASSTDITASVDASTWTFWLGDGSVTDTYLFSNTSEQNPSYAFCFTPSDRTLTSDLSFKYSANSSYPQRTWQLNDGTLTNTTTNQILYLLGAGDGIYSSIQTTETTGTPISNVQITIERQFSGVWTLLETGLTGSDGLVTFWVNPNFDHRLVAVKDGYTSTTVMIRPSQTLYTMILTRTTGEATFSGSLEGMSWSTSPPAGYLTPGTYDFTFNLTANLNNLDGSYCKLEIVNISSDILSSIAGGSSGGCNLTLSYTHITGHRIFGKLYVDTTNTTGYIIIDSDLRWGDIEGTEVNVVSTIYSFFTELKDLDEWGVGTHRQEWNRVVLFFFFLTLLVGIFSHFTQWDSQNPGAAILLIWFAVIFASLSGWFTIGLDSLTVQGFEKLDKYLILLITSFLTGGWYLGHIRRNS